MKGTWRPVAPQESCEAGVSGRSRPAREVGGYVRACRLLNCMRANTGRSAHREWGAEDARGPLGAVPIPGQACRGFQPLIQFANAIRERFRIKAQKPLRGAGGNRTPVRRGVNVTATTIPVVLAQGSQGAGSPVPENHPLVFARCQESFLPVSGLSHRPPLLLLPGCSDQAPRGLTARSFPLHYLIRSGSESEVSLVGASC